LVRFSRRFSSIALGFLLLAVLIFATRNVWLTWLGEALVFTTPPCKADVIVVLAGDYEGNRMLKAGELQREGWAPLVLVSGAGRSYGVNEGELAIQFAIRAGYPSAAFQNIPSPARSTEEEAEYMAAILRRRGVHRFLLVTSDYHSHRAADIYRKTAPDIPFCVVAAHDPDFTPGGWWHTREGRKTAFFEWCKTLAHVLHI
jgi:uncharacterized SAM-binding protein YcdF (DUF218 family)